MVTNKVLGVCIIICGVVLNVFSHSWIGLLINGAIIGVGVYVIRINKIKQYSTLLTCILATLSLSYDYYLKEKNVIKPNTSITGQLWYSHRKNGAILRFEFEEAEVKIRSIYNGEELFREAHGVNWKSSSTMLFLFNHEKDSSELWRFKILNRNRLLLCIGETDSLILLNSPIP